MVMAQYSSQKVLCTARFALALLIILECTCVMLSLLPFEIVKAKIDALGRHGSTDFFTARYYAQISLYIRITSLAILLLSILFLKKLHAYLVTLFQSFLQAVKDVLQLCKRLCADKKQMAGLLIIIIFAVVMRIWFLFEPMRYDEATAFTLYSSTPLQYALSNYFNPGNHLFQTFLTHVSYKLFGNEPWILRLPLLIAGVLVVPVIYIVMAKLFTATAALFGAGLVAASSAMIIFSTNARGYMLLCLFFLMLIGLGLYLLEHNNSAAWMGYTIVTALGFFTIPVMLYPFGIVATWLLIAALRRKIHYSARAFIGKSVTNAATTIRARVFFSIRVLPCTNMEACRK